MTKLLISSALLAIIIGSIFSLKHLQTQSEVKTIISELEHYKATTSAFKNKYSALPGDFNKASEILGSPSGDGDGKIGISSEPETHQEVMLFWQHLAKAGFISGDYTGISGPGESGYHAIIGENVPASNYKNAGWSIHPDIGEATNNKSRYDGYYGSYLFFGRETPRAVTYGEILSAKDMKIIDTKIDDGMPSTGSIVSAKPALSPNCVSENDKKTVYKATTNPDSCHIVIKNVAGF